MGNRNWGSSRRKCHEILSFRAMLCEVEGSYWEVIFSLLSVCLSVSLYICIYPPLPFFFPLSVPLKI